MLRPTQRCGHMPRGRQTDEATADVSITAGSSAKRESAEVCPSACTTRNRDLREVEATAAPSTTSASSLADLYTAARQWECGSPSEFFLRQALSECWSRSNEHADRCRIDVSTVITEVVRCLSQTASVLLTHAANYECARCWRHVTF